MTRPLPPPDTRPFFLRYRPRPHSVMSSPTAVFEHAYYIGGQIGMILYGVQLVLYFSTLQAFRHKSDLRRHRSDLFFAVYSTIMTLLLTIDISTNAVWGEQMWITSRSQPGGVEGFIATETSVWYQTLSSTSVVALIFMSDGLLVSVKVFVVYLPLRPTASLSYPLSVTPKLRSSHYVSDTGRCCTMAAQHLTWMPSAHYGAVVPS